MKSWRYPALFLAAILATTGLIGQTTVTLRCEITGCNGNLGLYTFDGMGFRETQRVNAPTDNVYEFKLASSAPRFYYTGPSPDAVLPVIIGEEKLVVIKGACNDMRFAEIATSKINQDYDKVKQQMDVLNNRSGQLLRNYAYATDDAQRQTLQGQMKSLDGEKVALLDSLKKASPFLARVAALNTYLSYQNNNGGKYDNELDYFAGEFFRFADFKDKGYDNLPWVYESFKSFSQTLSGINLPEEQLTAYLDKSLGLITTGTSAHQLAMAGILAGLQQRKHPVYPAYAEQFIQNYQTKAPEAAATVQAYLERARRLMVGSEAPDFSQQTPDGKELKLSDLRGKYVLIDFWASWCGPCRRENPNVVRLYQEYSSKGFEILGVSLDQNRDKWLEAIETDKLTWLHVSDLKGWSNAVGRIYEVSSIPKTVLVDPQGKIIAKDLRGPSLERKLAELFN